MAEGMVAELTLRIINEMNGGVSEVNAELSAIKDSAQQLGGELDEVSAIMAEIQAPAKLLESMNALETQAAEVAGSIGEIKAELDELPSAITAATTAADLFGAAVDADTTKVQAMVDAWKIPSMIPPDVSGENNPAFIPPGAPPPNEPPPVVPVPDEEPEGGGGGWRTGGRSSGDLSPEKHTMGIGDLIMGSIALASGYEGEKDYAAFQETALQTAIIEGYSGAAAKQQAQKIMDESYNQAYLSRGNVDDIEEAYFNLIRQKLPTPLVDQMMGPLTEAATTYNTPVADITGPMYNLADQFQIPGSEMPQGLAILGAASHLGHYYFSDFGTGLPQVSTQFARIGDTGLTGEAEAASALEIVRRGTPDSGTDATDLSYLVNYLTSPIAARFFDRTKRSQDLMGGDVMDLFHKYHIDPMNLPQYLDHERDDGVDPLNAMVDYMHTIGAGKMSPTDQAFVFNSLFHSVEAATAMQTLVGNYGDFQKDQKTLGAIGPGFLDENFNTAIQGDSGGMAQLAELGTYVDRLYGQNTFGLFGNTTGAPSQANANAYAPGSSAFNIPINLTVNVDKSGNATATATPAFGARRDDGLTQQYLPTPGVNLKVNQGPVLSQP